MIRVDQFLLRVASRDPKVRRVLLAELEREAARPKSEHKPGDTWKTPTGFRAMSPKGVAKTFDSPEAAKGWANGEGKAKSDKPSEGPKKGDKTRGVIDRKKPTLSQKKDATKGVVKGIVDLNKREKPDASFGSDLADVLAVWDSPSFDSSLQSNSNTTLVKDTKRLLAKAYSKPDSMKGLMKRMVELGQKIPRPKKVSTSASIPVTGYNDKKEISRLEGDHLEKEEKAFKKQQEAFDAALKELGINKDQVK